MTRARQYSDESLRVLREEGLRSLSIRKVARNLGFSHGAPYRHFPTREHLLAALAERGFTLFSAALLRDLPPLYATEKLELRLEKMCANYFAFAFDNPDYYQYIFGTSHFDHAAFPPPARKKVTAHLLYSQSRYLP